MPKSFMMKAYMGIHQCFWCCLWHLFCFGPWIPI